MCRPALITFMMAVVCLGLVKADLEEWHRIDGATCDHLKDVAIALLQHLQNITLQAFALRKECRNQAIAIVLRESQYYSLKLDGLMDGSKDGVGNKFVIGSYQGFAVKFPHPSLDKAITEAIAIEKRDFSATGSMPWAIPSSSEPISILPD